MARNDSAYNSEWIIASFKYRSLLLKHVSNSYQLESTALKIDFWGFDPIGLRIFDAFGVKCLFRGMPNNSVISCILYSKEKLWICQKVCRQATGNTHIVFPWLSKLVYRFTGNNIHSCLRLDFWTVHPMHNFNAQNEGNAFHESKLRGSSLAAYDIKLSWLSTASQFISRERGTLLFKRTILRLWQVYDNLRH